MNVSTPDGSGRVLLHCCCAPCSGAIIECLLENGIRPTIFFSNSNIFPRGEYEKRRAEIRRYAAGLGLETVDDEYDHDAWLESVKGLEKEPERGARCLECFRFRLRRAARYAAENGFTVLTTTLASSRWKDLGQVERAGEDACKDTGVVWWTQNWRKGGLQLRRSEIIAEQGFYNQDFCGCEFSRRSARIMGILNLTPDSFMPDSRVTSESIARKAEMMIRDGATILDLGAVSTRPGAASVSVEEEWSRLENGLRKVASIPEVISGKVKLSIDTTSSEIVCRAFDTVGPFIVNDISSGEDDPSMLLTVGRLHLTYIAMHKRGNPRTMDAMTDYSWASDGTDSGIVGAVLEYFQEFAEAAAEAGIHEWILDPGFGFAKTKEQNIELMGRLSEMKRFGKKILVGVADKRFTEGDTEKYHRIALRGGADILRVHDVAAASGTVLDFRKNSFR